MTTTAHDTRIMQKAAGEVPPRRPGGYPGGWDWVLDETCGMWCWCENALDLGQGSYKRDKRGFFRRTSSKALYHDRRALWLKDNYGPQRDKALGITFKSRTQKEEYYRRNDLRVDPDIKEES